MIRLAEKLKDVQTVAIAGHVRPDGDCVGSCLAVYNYIREQFSTIEVTVYLEPIAPVFRFLKGADDIVNECEQEKVCDLFIALDSSDKERLGAATKYFDLAKKTLCIDHHISNQGYAGENMIVPEASSTAELVYKVLEEESVSGAVAEAVYLGIVHDTGVFQYSNTSEETMQIAGKLMSKGIPFTEIIDKTFYKKTFVQNQILGRALMESRLLLEGRCIVSQITAKDLEFYQATSKDLDGIVNQLRITEGVEVAVFLYETGPKEYKVSMRSNGQVNVSEIASSFGGGGHVKAAGCTMSGTVQSVVESLTLLIAQQLEENSDKRGIEHL